MRKLILIVHTSMDGYIAHTDGSFDGLNPGSNNLDYVCDVVSHTDTILSGKTTFQMLESYWPKAHLHPEATPSKIRYSHWYNRARKIIVSTTMKIAAHTTIIHQDIPEYIHRLKQKEGGALVIFGSPTLFQSILPFNLIDEYHIILYPVILGNGIPLFKGTCHCQQLFFSKITPLANGEVALKCLIHPT